MIEAITQAAAYDLIDRFLRNNLYDDDYAKYSEALEALSQPAPSPQAPGRRKGPPGITLEPQGHELPAVPVADHPDTLRCIKARNDLNAALHGEGASIDDLEHAVANACAKLRRPAVEPMTDVWAMADIEQACVMAEVPPAQFESISLWLETEGCGITAKAEGGA